MSPSDALSAASAEFQSARAELRSALAEARAELEEAQREPLFTAEETQQLQQLAERGALGRGMQDVADEIRRGRAGWEALFRGHDGHHAVIDEFIANAQAEHGDRLALAFAESEAPDDVEDPRG